MRRFVSKGVIIAVATGISLFFVLAGILIIWTALLPIPDLSSFGERRIEQSTKILDRTGQVVLFDFVGDKKRQFVPLHDISRHVKNATVAIEDGKFYDHFGLRPLSIVRATLTNIFSLGFEQGGSTITQQLVKNTLLTFDKSISRKLKEWVLSIKIEGVLTKEEILGLYLNEIPYGGTVYGVGEASQVFFNKNPADLSLAEAAYIASLPKAPSFYSPYGENLDALKERKNLVLSRMFELGMINEEEYNLALVEEVVFRDRIETNIKAPHFVFFVKDSLSQRYRINDPASEWLSVTTTLDYNLQRQLEEIIKEGALENEEKFNAENAGVVVTDVKTGEILAMVGSRDYFDPDIDGRVNVTTSLRQPGSVFKPFAYAAAFNKGFTPSTVVFDVPTQFHESCEVDNFETDDLCYSPQNYDNVFRGPIKMRDALAQSINIPSVKTLFLAGLNETFNLAQNMGISTLTDPLRYGLTLVLGGGEVRLVDVVNSYATFGREGVFVPYRSILSINKKSGGNIETVDLKRDNVLDVNIARMINEILQNNEARAPAFGEHSFLRIDEYDVAVKTGTTNDYRDAWIVGYSPNVAVGVWAGNNDNSPMVKKVAGLIVAPIWNKIVKIALKEHGDGNDRFAPPFVDTQNIKPVLNGVWIGNEEFEIDTVSKGLATEHTPKETRKLGHTFDPHSILHWVDKDNPRGSIPEFPSATPQYHLWEYGVENWVRRNVSENDFPAKPDFEDNVHIPSNFPEVEIVRPVEGGIYKESDEITISFSTNGKYRITSYEIYLNDNLLGVLGSIPIFKFIPNQTPHSKDGKNVIKVIARDSVFNSIMQEVEINII